jgi:hypothetical protein
MGFGARSTRSAQPFGQSAAADLRCMIRSVSTRQITAFRPARAGRASISGLSRVLEENGTLVIAVGAFALVMLIALRHGLVVDGWMALVSGREVAQHGLPSHETLTIWAHGHRWVDQQWLAQLILYGLARAGGFKLALLVHAALGVGGLALAATAARRLGGSARSATWVTLPALVAYYPESSVLRPQSFAYPLFAAVLWLVVADSRSPSRRVFATFPILALWANVHGSVLLGAGLVSLAGLIGLAQGLLARPHRFSWRAAVLVLGPWPCLLVSPYALHLPAYYEKVLVGSDFGRFVSEWAPTTLTRSTAAVYLLVLAGMWLIGRAGGARITTFEKFAFVAMSVVAFQAVRNTAWLGLTALIVLPVLVDALRRPGVEPRRLNRLLATAMLGVVLVAAFAVAAKPQGWFTGGFPPAAAAAAARVAGPHGKVIASSPYADWLLWSEPKLSGRVAFDARYELLTKSQLSTLGAFEARVGAWMTTTRGYAVVVLGAQDDRKLEAALLGTGTARVVHRDAAIVVLSLR